MPNWNEVLNEIGQDASEGPADRIRRKHLKKLYNHTERNTIAYYSGWLQSGAKYGIDINDMDMNGLMSAICGLDCSKGLDLILHTPGGSISAAEQIVIYLKSKFNNNIRAIIPQIAMSAGTMIACSCNCIIMGNQSCLGPIDPQLGGISAKRVLSEFEQAKNEIKNDPSCIPIWQTIIGKYHPTFVQSCELACDRANMLVSTWLSTNMFDSDTDKQDKAKRIVDKFIEIGSEFDHDKHICLKEAIDLELNIKKLEEDQELQDLVLTVHHAFMHTFAQGNIVKAIENHNGIAMFNFANSN